MLPHTERLLLGPGPSPVASRIMRAMAAPVLSHLDPDMMAILDDIRSRLGATFRAPDTALALAISGTGSSGMEAAVANVTRPGSRALVVVTGYFGDRLTQMLQRYGATVERVETEWGRACDPSAVERALKSQGADIVAMVHAETSTGVLNPVGEICGIAAQRGALTIVDTVTSLGAHPVEAGTWRADVVYSCTQKGLGAPSGLAPIVFSARASASSSRQSSGRTQAIARIAPRAPAHMPVYAPGADPARIVNRSGTAAAMSTNCAPSVLVSLIPTMLGCCARRPIRSADSVTPVKAG